MKTLGVTASGELRCPRCGYEGTFNKRGALQWSPGKPECPRCGKAFEYPSKRAIKAATRSPSATTESSTPSPNMPPGPPKAGTYATKAAELRAERTRLEGVMFDDGRKAFHELLGDEVSIRALVYGATSHGAAKYIALTDAGIVVFQAGEQPSAAAAFAVDEITGAGMVGAVGRSLRIVTTTSRIEAPTVIGDAPGFLTELAATAGRLLPLPAEKARDVRRLPLATIGLAVLATAALGVCVASSGEEESGPPMPSLVGQDVGSARERFAELGDEAEDLTVMAVGGGEYEDSWVVCQQVPDPGDDAAEDAAIFVSETCDTDRAAKEEPDSDEAVESARSWLTEHGLNSLVADMTVGRTVWVTVIGVPQFTVGDGLGLCRSLAEWATGPGSKFDVSAVRIASPSGVRIAIKTATSDCHA